MELHWLRLVQSCVLELRPLKDYSGQELIFNPQAFTRRCVTKSTLEHELVQRYITMRMIEMEKPAGVPAAAPSVRQSAPEVPAVQPEPVVVQPAKVEELEVPAEPEAPAEIEADAPSETLPVPAEEEMDADAESAAPAPTSEASVSEPSPEPSSEEELAKPRADSYKKKRR